MPASADSSIVLQCWMEFPGSHCQGLLVPGRMISQIRISATPLGTWKVFGSVPELPRPGRAYPRPSSCRYVSVSSPQTLGGRQPRGLGSGVLAADNLTWMRGPPISCYLCPAPGTQSAGVGAQGTEHRPLLSDPSRALLLLCLLSPAPCSPSRLSSLPGREKKL